MVAAAPAPAPAKPVAAATSKEYAGDVAKVCDVISLAGAADAPSQADRNFLIAQYLGKSLVTADARAFLVRIQPLEGEAKAAALDAEAARAGLAGCALAAELRKLL